ncbi:MAG: ABC transporter permease [Bacteroidetes bacterium]|nr:MAG: ABC transporter permease [Bacteroidota bacterium]
MNLSLFIAKRYLISKKSHNAINIITLISIAGVCIGTMAIVIVLSAFNGISALVFGLYNTFDPDIKITPKEGKTFIIDSPAAEKIKKMDGVVYYTEVLQENALLKYDDKQVIATIKGVSGDFVKMTRLDTVTREGEFMLQRDSIDYAVLGYGLARRLNISLIDFMHPLEIYVPKRDSRAVINPEDAFLVRSVEVSGIFSLNDDFDYRYAILPLSLARTLLNRNDELSAIEVGLKPGTDVIKAKKEIQEILNTHLPELRLSYARNLRLSPVVQRGGESLDSLPLTTEQNAKVATEGQPGWVVKTRYEQNEILFKTINSEKWWTFLILAFILVIAIFNVIGSLTMLIIEKKKDIQTLMFLGADKSLIQKIFMREGLMITLTGVFSGLSLGLILCWLQTTFKLVPFSEGFIVDSYPVKVIPMDLALVFGTVLFIGFCAVWYPVRIFTRSNHLPG